MANSVDPDQTAPSGAVGFGSALFAYIILSETLVFEILGNLPYVAPHFANLHARNDKSFQRKYESRILTVDAIFRREKTP